MYVVQCTENIFPSNNREIFFFANFVVQSTEKNLYFSRLFDEKIFFIQGVRFMSCTFINAQLNL